MNHKNLSLTGLKKLASKLGVKYKSKNLVIGLVGELGSGKTTFTKNFAKAFNIKKIKSPTFIILASYILPRKNFYHLDFYRLKHLSELEVVGLNELLTEKNRTILIEWVDKFPKILKQCDLIIKFEIVNKQTRNVTISHN
ncbi:MAG: tRNA (adenosine(37)-N6)-threonylcarbamoyltransferase complex ATPase subunit type 1 TsaE [bacterium]|nr:tRNA (adenosine(37)-N6)-threonylcarbamoyltransferase complex ATPase subunit type 1 TsaE [bacterium]